MTDPALKNAMAHDEKLAQLLDELSEQLRAGKPPDVERVAAEHPGLAKELRELWPAVMMAWIAGMSSVADKRATSGAPAMQQRPIELPRRCGDYELIEELGRGGMGVVYKARQVSLSRTVALKMISRGDLASADELARFRSEAESAARLDHPSIVPVYEVGQLDGQPFFSMKFIEGTTLARRLTEGPLAPREAAAILATVSRAVQFAHQRGVVHRDLKPSNILLDELGQPHVTDFGLAKRVSSADAGAAALTRSGAILGTPAYMAPEQAAGSRGQVGPATDVYSLGAILYQMLTGHPPFQAPSPVDVVLMVLEQDPLPPRLLNVKADRELELIALRAMQKPADLRYPSAGALADDLDAYLSGEPISARSGRFTDVMSRLFRETHHATVLENWGLLWMWHSLVLLVLCLATNWLHWRGALSPWPYLAIWAGGLLVWAPIFWALRRRAGPVTAVERQIAHVWGASVLASIMLFFVEILLGLPVLTLSPVLGLIGGVVFVVKAAILSGAFYFQAAAMFLAAVAMAVLPEHGLLIFGLISAACFFIPGWKYYWQGERAGQL